MRRCNLRRLLRPAFCQDVSACRAAFWAKQCSLVRGSSTPLFSGVVDFIQTSLYTGLQLFRSQGERHENRNRFV